MPKRAVVQKMHLLNPFRRDSGRKSQQQAVSRLTDSTVPTYYTREPIFSTDPTEIPAFSFPDAFGLATAYSHETFSVLRPMGPPAERPDPNLRRCGAPRRASPRQQPERNPPCLPTETSVSEYPSHRCRRMRREKSCRVICIEKAKWSILPFSGVVDTDPFRGNHPRLIRWIVQEIKLVSSQVEAVLRAGDLKCPSKPTGPREIGLPTVKRLGGADEYRLGFSHTSGHDVQHLIHPVDQVHVGPSCGAKQDLGSPRPPFGGVRCQIVRAEIRFGLHDTRLKCLPVNMAHEDLSDQRAGQFRRRSPEKRPREFLEGRS